MKRALLTAIMAGAALGAGGTASAQDAAGSLDEIIVTAQRREQNLQNVPIAVTAFSSAAIERQGITELTDLNNLAPGLRIIPLSGATPLITIRGINGGFSLPGVDSPVALYIDGVYIGRLAGTMFDMTDLERIEVLRGPQGTLFGRNATIGAISFISRGPSGRAEAQADASIGNYNLRRVRTRINLPTWNNISAQFSYMHLEQDGYATNLGRSTYDLTTLTRGRIGRITSAETIGLKDVDGFQAALRFAPAETVTFDYRFDYTDSVRTDPPAQVIGFPPTGAFPASIFANQAIAGGTTANLSLARKDELFQNLTTPQFMKVWGHSLTAAWEMSPDITLKSITSYRSAGIKGYGTDNRVTGGLKDPTPGPTFGQDYFIGGTAQTTSTKQVTQELQAQYSSEKVQVTAGGFYFWEKVPYYAASFRLQAVPQAPARILVAGGGENFYDTKNYSLAGYAQGTYNVTDAIELTGGVRYTYDNRSTTIFAALIGAQLPAGTYKRGFENVDWTAVASYKFNDDVNVYAKAATGYTSGGVFSGIAFNPQKLRSYEGGLKSELFNHRLRANLSGYYNRIKNLQVPAFNRGFLELTNAGLAEGHGFEGEFTAAPVDGLTLTAGVTLQWYKYLDYVVGTTNLGSRGLNTIFPAQQPRRSLNWGATYEFHHFAEGGNAFISIDGSLRSRIRLLTARTGDAAIDRAVEFGAGSAIVNARLGVAEFPMGSGAVSVSLWGKNLFDEDVMEAATNLSTIVAAPLFVEPTMFGIDLSFRF